jgi:hypothetical protein
MASSVRQDQHFSWLVGAISLLPYAPSFIDGLLLEPKLA